MENKRLTTDLENEASSEETRSSEETLSDDTDKPRARGRRPNKCPRRESPKPEHTFEIISGEETTVIKSENGNDDDSEPIPTSGGSVSLAFLTVNVSIAASNAARAASAAAHAAYDAAAASANAVNAVYSAAHVANHAAATASAAARAASVAATLAVAHDRLPFVSRVGITPGRRGRRGTARVAPSSGSAPPHAG